jgi:hypothetical protein
MLCDSHDAVSGNGVGSWLERREVPITSSLFSISLGAMGKYREEMGTQQGSPDSEPLPLRYVGEQTHHQKYLCCDTGFSAGFFPKVCTAELLPDMESEAAAFPRVSLE